MFGFLIKVQKIHIIIYCLLLTYGSLWGESLLVNAGFEMGLRPGWQTSFVTGVTVDIDSTICYSGGKSLRIENMLSYNKAFYGCNQRISTLHKEKWYRITSAIKILDYNGRFGIAVHYYDERGNKLPISDADISFYVSDETKDWEVHNLDFYVPRESSVIIVALYIQGQGTVWFDDLKMIMLDSNTIDSLEASQNAYLLYEKDPLIWFECAEKKVFRNTHIPYNQKKDKIEIFSAKNESESFQLVMTSLDYVDDCSIIFSDLRNIDGYGMIPKEQLTYSCIGYIEVATASSPEGFAGLHPDYLKRKKIFKLEKKVNTPIWINILIPDYVKAGRYEGLITLNHRKGQHINIPIDITVWDFALPNTNHIFVRSNFWLSLIEKYDNRRKSEIRNDYYLNLREHRINALRDVSLKVSYSDGKLVCNFADFDAKTKKLFVDYEFDAITIGPFLGDASGWQHRREWLNTDPGSFEFEIFFSQYCKMVEEHLKEKGWLNKCWIQYWDEPRASDPGFDNIVKIGRLIKKAAPELKIFMTTKPISVFNNIVDIWCIPYNKQSYNYKDIVERQSLGDQIFIYHNDPYIDTPLIDKRLYAWRYWIAGIDGVYSWWNLTYWQQNPYYSSAMIQYGDNNKKVHLKAGDGVLLYPNPDSNGPPVNSLRWEIYRQGLEDYEYFWLLEQKINRVLQQLKTNELFSNYGQYRINEIIHMVIMDHLSVWLRDVSMLYKLRQKIAEEILYIDKHPYVFIKTDPCEGNFVTDTIKVYGITESNAQVKVNGKEVDINNNTGLFVTTTVLMAHRILTIIIETDGKEKIITREFK